MERRLAAVLAADIVGYSRLMEADELGVLHRQRAQFDALVLPHIRDQNGRIVKTTGDGFLAEFPSVVDAVNCALAFQQALTGQEADDASAAPIRYRTGINIGDIIIQGDDIFGDGVNVAARLEAIAPPGGLCISELVWQNLRGALSGEFQDIGAQVFKNIDRRIRAFKWPADENAALPTTGPGPVQNVQLAVSDPRCSPRDTDAADFADGLICDLIVSLSKLDTLNVVRMQSDDPAQARYVLEGNARSSGQRLRCNMQLREVATSALIWAERFEGSFEDVFEFQDNIIDSVVAGIEIELSDGPQVRRWRREAGDTRAYELFLDGRTAYKEYSRRSMARARDLFQSAIEIAPGFHSATVSLARTFIEDASFGWAGNKSESLEQARNILETVLAANPQHSAAHAETAHVLMRSGEFQAALPSAELAVALDPNDAEAFAVLSFVLNCVGRYEEALHVSRRALALNPSGPEFYLLPMLQAYLALGRYTEAVGMADRILAQRPAWLTTHVLKILALHRAGREDEARTAVAEMQTRNPRFGIARWIATLHNRDQYDISDTIARLRSVGMNE